jgi:hypothetical protein
MIRRGPTLTEAELNRETLTGERAEYPAFEGDPRAFARKCLLFADTTAYRFSNFPGARRIRANYMIKITKAAASVWSNFSPRQTPEMI